MKQLFLTSILLITSLFAQAEAPNHELANTFTQFYHSDLDPSFGIHGRTHSTVQISKEFVSLNVMQLIDGQLQSVLFAKLPIVKVSKSCGSTVITAQSSLADGDSLIEEITLFDHTTRLCKDRVPFVTEMTYTTIAPRSQVKTESYFGGSALQPTFE